MKIYIMLLVPNLVEQVSRTSELPDLRGYFLRGAATVS